MYPEVWSANEWPGVDELDQSLDPRPPEWLYTLAGEAGLGAGHLLLDAGCGRAIHAAELMNRFGCRAVGADAELGNLVLAPAGLLLAAGDVEALPFASGAFDIVWCRDMLVHVRDLDGAAAEYARVLRNGGALVAWVTFATPLLSNDELDRFCATLELNPDCLSQPRVERAFARAGFHIERREGCAAEWVEYREETEGRAACELMRVARLRRAPEKFAARFGQRRYELLLALFEWHIFQLLGKLSSAAYVLRRVGSPALPSHVP